MWRGVLSPVYSLVVQRIKDLNHLFVSVDTLSVRVYLSFRALYTDFTSLMPHGDARHDVTSRFYIAYTSSHYIITSAAIRRERERESQYSLSLYVYDYRYSIDRRLHRQPSPWSSPRNRSSCGRSFGLAAIHPYSFERMRQTSCFRS